MILGLAGCVSSTSVGYRDAAGLPDGFVGRAHRAWIEGATVFVEVDQDPDLQVVAIDHRIEGDAVYLMPRRLSVGSEGCATFRIDLPEHAVAPGATPEVYWHLGETYYPLLNAAFWNPAAREPTARVRVQLGTAPARVAPER